MQSNFDCIVVGATPGGISAALTASRLGHSVALVEYHPHIGGMASSGLGKSDIENRPMIQGIFSEFVDRVLNYYQSQYGNDSENVTLCKDGYYYEPSVAELIFEQMIREQKHITLLKYHSIESVVSKNNLINGVIVKNRKNIIAHKLFARVIIDATYEGDVYALAGAAYRLGRESRDEYGEPHAGIVYYDYIKKKFLPGTTGEADNRLPAYTYRLCLSTEKTNSAPLLKPPVDYDESLYIGYLDDLKAGRLSGPKNPKPGRGYYTDHFNTLVRALSITEIPNRKTDVNMNPRPLSFPFAEENQNYIQSDSTNRERICERIRNITLGLLWFLQQSAQAPENHKTIANQYHLPLDEFIDNNHFPYQLYIREARRLVGLYTLTELDITRNAKNPNGARFPDAIAVGEFPVDVHPVRKRQPNDTLLLEGFLGMLDDITVPYQIPFRIMIPELIDGLIVPVAASTTHVAFSSIRMEPTWMALGQAAGVAAHIALKSDVQPRHVNVQKIQNILRKQNQVINPT